MPPPNPGPINDSLVLKAPTDNHVPVPAPRPRIPREEAQPAVILLDCTGVGWGNRFRSLQVR